MPGLDNRNRDVGPLIQTRIDDYFKPTSNTDRFHAVFPLLAHQYTKWKEGVRLWPGKRNSVMPYNGRHESPAMDLVISRQLAVGIWSVEKNNHK